MSESCCCLPSSVVGLSRFHQPVYPIFYVVSHNLGEDIPQGSICHFHLAIFLRVVGSGSLMLYLVPPQKILNEMRCELCRLISEYLSGVSKFVKHILSQKFGYLLLGWYLDNLYFSPLCQVVSCNIPTLASNSREY